MLNKKNSMKIEYNKMYDILYVNLKDCYDSYVEEREQGILINHDFKTNEIIGIEIWDFKKRIENNEKFTIPFPVNLEEIFKSIAH